jgi:dihydrofolate reductase
MQKLILQMSVSLDGFVARPDGNLDWIFPTHDAGLIEAKLVSLREASAHVMGARTYRDMAAYWPTEAAAGNPFAPVMNELPKVVFSDTLQAADWPGTRIVAGDLGAGIRALQEEPGEAIVAHGGAGLAQSLSRLGLVDEYRLVVHPVALGDGLPLFADLDAPLELELVSGRRFAAGSMLNVYRPAA